ncbi:MAG: alpha-ketoacid dehydrogenase subunit beta, partial [Chloroflexi bacterium]|nr:alpha-ketoacid dehydrogenase subunit beta [Chloroflexota bacterium]
MATRTITFSEAINEAMRLEMRRDPTVILMGEDVAGGATLPHMEGEGKEA